MVDYAGQYPFGSPTISGSNITVDLMLKNPTRITTYLSDIVLQNYFADRIFLSGGDVSGGALIYTQLLANDLYATREVQKIAPGAEFPRVTFERPVPQVATVEKYGGKFDVTDEARDRNDMTAIQSESIKLGNTIQRQIHKTALAALDASVTAIGAPVQMTGVSWKAAKSATLTTTATAAQPAADFAEAQKKAEVFELGGQFDLWIVNPQEMTNFQIVYGDRWQDVLSAWGMDMVASNIVTAGSAYVVAERQVGELRFEKPLTTVTYREDERETTWVQSSVRPVCAVTRPFSVLKVTGLAA